MSRNLDTLCERAADAVLQMAALGVAVDETLKFIRAQTGFNAMENTWDAGTERKLWGVATLATKLLDELSTTADLTDAVLKLACHLNNVGQVDTIVKATLRQEQRQCTTGTISAGGE